MVISGLGSQDEQAASSCNRPCCGILCSQRLKALVQKDWNFTNHALRKNPRPFQFSVSDIWSQSQKLALILNNEQQSLTQGARADSVTFLMRNDHVLSLRFSVPLNSCVLESCRAPLFPWGTGHCPCTMGLYHYPQRPGGPSLGHIMSSAPDS